MKGSWKKFPIYISKIYEKHNSGHKGLSISIINYVILIKNVLASLVWGDISMKLRNIDQLYFDKKYKTCYNVNIFLAWDLYVW